MGALAGDKCAGEVVIGVSCVSFVGERLSEEEYKTLDI